MNKTMKNFLLKAMLLMAVMVIAFACKKDDQTEPQPPVLTFDRNTMAVNTDENASFEVKILLSTAAFKDFDINVNLGGTAVEDEHYTVDSKVIKVTKGQTEALLPVSLLVDNIFDSELTLEVIIATGTDYLLDPAQPNKAVITLTREIVLPELYFATNTNIQTNPFWGETIKLTVTASETLKYDGELQLEFETQMVAGTDYQITGADNNRITIAAGETTKDFELVILKKDDAGFDKELKISLKPVDPKRIAIYAEKGTQTIEVKDPLVDLTPMLKTPALVSGEGYQIRQAIKAPDNTWLGNIVINSSQNQVKKNYLKTHRNLTYVSTFDCLYNTSGGDVLRLADMLKFETTDTLILDYGANNSTRYFSTTDELMRFVGDVNNPLKGVVIAPRQKFTARLGLRSEWEEGVNPNKAWQIDSRANNGDITKSIFNSFHTMEVWLEKLEGTYDFTLTEPEVIFTAWYKSDSKYFMRIMPTGLDIVKDGGMYKVTYRYYPR